MNTSTHPGRFKIARPFTTIRYRPVGVGGHSNVLIVISYVCAMRVRVLNLFGTPGWDVPDQ